MNKQISDYLHLYLGCEVETEGAKIRTLNLDLLKLVFDDKMLVVPILRPLSDMTEDENDISFDLGGDALNTNGICYSPEMFKYLLSKHFDLFGLIEAGLAIDKTKTTH